METRKPVTVGATETSLRIIDALRTLDGAGVTDLAEHLELPKSTVHNHLQTLRRNEYVTKQDSQYAVGLRFLQLGEYARDRRQIATIAPPEIDKLAEETREMANLLVEEHGRGVFLYRAKGADAVHMDTHAGKRVHLHTTGFGKAILAHLPEERVDRILDRHGLPAVTPSTITDRERLLAELETVRERGYAYDDEERLEGLRCVAAPIVVDGDVLGAVSVSGPRSRIRDEYYREELPSLVMSTANVIEINSTYA
ncbi:IclR family transcriptional regulator [Halalkalicoccus sp. GCM10025322]|uniref:IclR family transcriptional regulator n=1 Tax=Halalkalicoccus TaxID=332246 RepID=UPI002F962C7C